MFDVMIIDDEFDVRKRLISIIDWENLPIRLVAEAADIDIAQELYILHRPKIVITDISLPMGSGLDLAETFLKEDPNLQCIVITGYSEIAYAQRALRMGALEFLLKPIFPDTINRILQKAVDQFEHIRQKEVSVDNMKRLLDENIPLIRDAYLGRLLRQGAENAAAVQARFQELQIDCPGPYYAVALLVLETDRQAERYESACLLMEKQMQALLAETPLYAHLFFDSHFRLTCLISAKDNLIDQALEAVLAALRSHLHFLDDFSLRAGVSCTVASLTLLPDAFEQAKKALSFQNVLSSDSVVHYKNVSAYEPVLVNSHLVADELRLLFIRNAHKEMEQRLIEHMEVLSRRDNGVSQMRAFALELLAALSSECSRQNIQTERVISGTSLMHMVSAQSAEELLSATLRLLHELLELQNAKQSSNSNHLIKLAKAYIAEHLNDSNLCLDSVSEAIGLSRNYFCDLFHRTEHVSFTNYLKAQRLSVAKELLLTTNLKVFEIADVTGFSNVKYFCYVFKRATGKTPSEFQVSPD